MKKSTFLMAALLCGSWCATAQTTEQGHEYVDLGLPSGLQWATCNVGATTPEAYGNYYAWGETEPKDTYTWSNYKLCNGSTVNNAQMTKYCTQSESGVVDNKTVLDLADDAANVIWRGKWRMPTETEWTELRTNCTWTWKTLNGVNGYEVKSTNGNSIFLPAAGYRGEYNSISDGNSKGNYWASSLDDYSKAARKVLFDATKVGSYSYYRRCGLSIRPVLLPTTYSITLTAENGTVTGAGIYPQDTKVMLTATANEGYHFVKWSDGDTDNPRTIIVTENVTLTAIFEGDPHTVTVTAGENGSVKVAANGTETAETVFAYGTKITLTATANEHYHFVKWSNGATAATYTFTLIGDTTLTATFAIDQHTVTIGEAVNGSVTGAGTYDYGAEAMLKATANEGYHFVKWSDGNTDNPRTITVTADVTLAAEFTATPTALETVTASPVYAERGRIYCAGDFRIYDLLGRDVTRLNGSLQGIYVVKTADSAQKVVVK
ncbi:MAG: InlB B-repeat-containing protein [Paludibacteraceae bacterium]|nr:InlB B-repeat-containing protein [Paludibacteraceae bacterium]